MADATTPRGVAEQVTACYCWRPKWHIGGDLWEMGVLKYRRNWQEEETGSVPAAQPSISTAFTTV